MSFRTRRGAAYRPWAFTEHGALMAANILRSPRARKMSIFVIRAFMRMREELAANATILKRLAEIDRTLLVHGARNGVRAFGVRNSFGRRGRTSNALTPSARRRAFAPASPVAGRLR